MARLDIIIVNWNAGGQLQRCLESIARAGRAGFDLARVVVVDNASTDRSAEGLEGMAIPLSVIRNPRNRGFAAACNEGASNSRADYLLFLNPDTELHVDSLERPLAFMQRAESRGVGITGIRLIDGQGAVSPSCARFPTPALLLSKSLGLYRLSPRLFPTYALADGNYDQSREVDYVSGAFLMVRRDLFEALGGFDERFFVYFEETDLSRRMHEGGYKSWYIAETNAFHRGGGVSEQAKAHRLFYAASSRILYARKHFRAIESLAFMLSALMIEPIARVTAAALSGSPEGVRDNIRGYCMLYRAVSRIARGRNVYDERS